MSMPLRVVAVETEECVEAASEMEAEEDLEEALEMKLDILNGVVGCGVLVRVESRK